MSLDDLVKVTISKQTASVSRTGFGTPLLMSAEAEEDARFTTTAKIYTALAELTTDGFDSAGVAFLKAQAIFAQNPKVDQLVIGKRASLPTKLVDLVPIVLANTNYVITIGGRGVLGADVETFTFDSGGSPTAATIIAGVLALINGGAQDVLATDVGPGTSMSIESAATPGGATAAGKPFTLGFDRSLWIAQDITVDPGLVADLNAIRTAIDGNDDWYALLLDTAGLAEISVLAPVIETIPRIFLVSSFDADILTAATTDIGSVLQALSLVRTSVMWHERPDLGIEAAWGGRLLPFDPGSATWKFKTLAGVAASLLTPAEDTFAKAKSVNRYLKVAGITITCDGTMAGGEFIDVTRGIDFITARLQENIFAQLAKLPKLPFTEAGTAVVENEVRGVMELGISQGIFTADPAPVVTVPLVADVDVTDRANRLLPDVNFTATLAGAIHAVEVNGVVTV